MAEIWKYYDETHKVSNLGRVMYYNGSYWVSVSVRNKNNFVFVRINRQEISLKKLVASLFVPNPNNLENVVCIDGDNIHADNLMWVNGRATGGRRVLDYETVMQRINEKHGDRIKMVGEYMKANTLTRFKCTMCGTEFLLSPHNVSIYKEPCPHCRMIKKDELLAKKRERERENKKKHRRDPKEKVYIIYAYIFDDGHAYVGLTKNKHQRDYAHRSSKSSAVFRYSKMTGKAIPKAIILEEGLDEEGAKRYEGLWKKWLSNTFSMLNVAPTGSLGGIYESMPHTIENARKAKERFRTRKALRWHCRWAWEMLKECDELPESKNRKMTLSEALKVKDIFKTRNKILKNSYAAYYLLKENNMLPKAKSNRIYSVSDCLEQLEKYKTRVALRHNAMWAYSVLDREGLLPPVEQTPYTLENAIAILKERKDRNAIRKIEWAFNLLKDNGMLPPCKKRGRKKKRLNVPRQLVIPF